MYAFLNSNTAGLAAIGAAVAGMVLSAVWSFVLARRNQP